MSANENDDPNRNAAVWDIPSDSSDEENDEEMREGNETQVAAPQPVSL